MCVNRDLLLASPYQTLAACVRVLSSAQSWRAIGASLIRQFAALGVGVPLGVLLAVLTGRVSLARAILSPALSAVRATPVASFIILAMVWMSSGSVPIFAASLIILPIIWQNVSQGIRDTDVTLLEMARVYRFGVLKTALHVVAPSVKGAFLAALSASIGLCLKAMVAAEVLGTPKLAVGTMLHNAKTYLATDELFAWTFIIILLSGLIEFCVNKLIRMVND